MRYCARPPLSLERLSTTPEGLVAYRLRKPWSADQTHRVMTPLEVMARLAALVPPPRHPLIRFHGVCAPHSSWRGSVVPERIAADSPASGSLQTAAAPDSGTEQPQAEGGSGRAPVAPHTDATPLRSRADTTDSTSRIWSKHCFLVRPSAASCIQ